MAQLPHAARHDDAEPFQVVPRSKGVQVLYAAIVAGAARQVEYIEGPG
jgi:hypothetical protein